MVCSGDWSKLTLPACVTGGNLPDSTSPANWRLVTDHADHFPSQVPAQTTGHLEARVELSLRDGGKVSTISFSICVRPVRLLIRSYTDTERKSTKKMSEMSKDSGEPVVKKKQKNIDDIEE